MQILQSVHIDRDGDAFAAEGSGHSSGPRSRPGNQAVHYVRHIVGIGLPNRRRGIHILLAVVGQLRAERNLDAFAGLDIDDPLAGVQRLGHTDLSGDGDGLPAVLGGNGHLATGNGCYHTLLHGSNSGIAGGPFSR
ncbi:hypothetical protein D3C76_1279710 [compost metagenome]